MNQLTFKGQHFPLRTYESVLDCLLRHGQAIPYACRAGMCQACLVKTVNCRASEDSQRWIKPALRERGYTLACQWVPESDVAAALPDIADFSTKAIVRERSLLNSRVLRLRLGIPDPATMFTSHPGQYLSLINPQGLSRPYSIANDYELDGYVELHIAATSHGVLSRWLFEEAAEGTTVHLRGATGECYYRESDMAAAPLLLAGTGTGLAPLFGIVRDALRQGHQARIDLFHCARDSAHLYLVDTLETLMREHANFYYHPCILSPNAPGSTEDLLAASLDTGTLAQSTAFLCGAPDFVHGMRKKLYLKGLRAQRIHSDPFTERQVAAPGSGDRT